MSKAIDDAMRTWWPPAAIEVYAHNGTLRAPMMAQYMGTSRESGKPVFALFGPAGFAVPPGFHIDMDTVPDWAEAVVEVTTTPLGYVFRQPSHTMN